MPPGLIFLSLFLVMLSRFIASERRHLLYSVFSHWLKPWYDIDGKSPWAGITAVLGSTTSLTHWARKKISAISQTKFRNAFSWMRKHEFHLWFHWSLFLRFELTIFQHWFRWWLGANQATSHYLNQWWLVYWCIYVSPGLNESLSVTLKYLQ